MDIVNQLASVALVLGLLGSLLWFSSRRRVPFLGNLRSARGQSLEIVEQLRLTPHASLHLIRWGHRRLLVAATPQSCTVIDTQTSREDAA